MDRIVSWLESCGYAKVDAIKEAESMIRCNINSDHEQLSREYVINMILADLEDC